MQLKVIGTGSSGNAYLLQQDGDSILLDAGMKWKEILAELPDGIAEIKACLITHEHKDHCKCVSDVTAHGISTVMSEGTYQEIIKTDTRLKHINRLYRLSAGDLIQFPPFSVMPVKALHDAAEPFAFLIRYEPTKETVLYATDTYALPNLYPDINYWLVECNYTTDKARELLDSPEKAPLFERLIRSHMSLERLCGTLLANDLKKTRTIVLVHISDERGDSDLMQNIIQNATGVKTIAAYNGLSINLGSCPF